MSVKRLIAVAAILASLCLLYYHVYRVRESCEAKHGFYFNGHCL